MDFFWTTLVVVAVLLFFVVLTNRRRQVIPKQTDKVLADGGTPKSKELAETTVESSVASTSSRPPGRLSESNARQWLDDFLVKQQED